MAELMKHMYNDESLRKFALTTQAVYEPFPVERFLDFIMDEEWENLELKARVRKISTGLGRYLPDDYEQALAILDQVAVKAAADRVSGFFCIFFPDFIEVYGQDEKYWELSMQALERYTVYSSSEFAVRPFIISHEERMMARMYA